MTPILATKKSTIGTEMIKNQIKPNPKQNKMTSHTQTKDNECYLKI